MAWWLAAVLLYLVFITVIVIYAMHGGHNVTTVLKLPFFRFFFKATKNHRIARRKIHSKNLTH